MSVANASSSRGSSPRDALSWRGGSVPGQPALPVLYGSSSGGPVSVVRELSPAAGRVGDVGVRDGAWAVVAAEGGMGRGGVLAGEGACVGVVSGRAASEPTVGSVPAAVRAGDGTAPSPGRLPSASNSAGVSRGSSEGGEEGWEGSGAVSTAGRGTTSERGDGEPCNVVGGGRGAGHSTRGCARRRESTSSSSSLRRSNDRTRSRAASDADRSSEASVTPRVSASFRSSRKLRHAAMRPRSSAVS
ncbi:uncharacterized protein CMC5_032740 [Chondromyces crocatus]|uniref:Uncharacterized protein n=1 Tax=Chondromyces crocatus TaxID=52 RepID=A0A0K1EEM3_CHOCO|nr:uncharacterized protein CMC5_032740 [Chondromyces crocatus]